MNFNQTNNNKGDVVNRRYVVGTSDELNYLRYRVPELEEAIRRHRDAKGHEACWLNDKELYEVLGEPIPNHRCLPPKVEFLSECEVYYDREKSREVSESLAKDLQGSDARGHQGYGGR